MGAVRLKYLGDWRTRILTCPICGWTGTFEEGLVEYHDYLQDCSCPGDHDQSFPPMLAVLSYPTLEDYKENWDSLSEDEKAYARAIEASVNRFEQGKLKSPDQLPDLNEPALDLVWDEEVDETVIRFCDQVIWREPVRYEGYWRYEEIVDLLLEKYGTRLRDLEPTERSWMDLYGDKMGAPQQIDRTRAELRDLWTQNSGGYLF